ncbi:scavenger receptor class B member 1 isoform X2 [Coccinella septempunctata]|uniref:scavenger receptor class B member 1 isoform X2 n=1 Tax=Coccinella septempunctata TaxID=41139 RepID=UPI001D06CA82|nr:scavenger receptor class B member 1 isoform X2 [Coccinella septempunctata]
MLCYKRLLTVVEAVCDTIDKIFVAVTQRKWAISFAVLGIASFISGLMIFIINPYDLIYRYKIIFGDKGEVFELWRVPPVDLYLRVFLWNITNKEEYMNGTDDKLKLQEVGPYVYKELMTHENVTFNDNFTVSAIPSHPLVFVPEMSEGRLENDTMILPNIALLSIAQVVSDENSYFTRLGLNMLIRQIDQQPLVEMTAREFMFNYTNALMNLGNQFMPNWITFKNLGLIDRMYDFDGDFETVYTGEDDVKKAGLIDMWRGSTKIPQWENPCGNVRGASDGAKFPSLIEPEDKLFFYRKSMCRAKYLVKVNETVKDTFKSYVYNFEEDSPETEQCLCYDKSKCFPKGLLDVHGCYYGFPIALSAPHFYKNDPILKAKVEGVHPDAEKHESYFVIEPRSGVPVELRANFQINMALRDLTSIAHVERFSDMVLPLLWAEFRLYGLPDSLRSRLQLYLHILPLVTDVLMYASTVCGLLMLIYSVCRMTRLKNNRNRRQAPWIQDTPHFIKNTLSSYKTDKDQCSSPTDKELETYYTSVIIPLTQELEETGEMNRSSATA